MDPYTQNITLSGPDGDKFQVSMDDIDWYRMYSIRLAINYGTQIGASGILLLVLLVLTKREKRCSSIFIMNALCLICNTVRSILQCLYLTSNYFNFYGLLAADFARVTSSERANTVASNTITLLLVTFIMVSLSMQVWVVCITTPKLQRFLIMGATTLLALIAIGYRFAVTIISNAQAMKDLGMKSHQRLLTTMSIMQAVAIWAYCVVFTVKLGYALMQRRKLGMTQFGPMQIIFIMGCQTMIIPAIFSSLQFYQAVPELGSQTLTVVCIFLPLSAIWAGVIASDASIGSNGADAHQRLLRGQFGRTPTGSTTNSRSGGTGDSSTTYTNDSICKEPASPITPNTLYKEKHSLGGVGHIHVNREWSVDHAQASHDV